jgi:hypothetical protein
MPVAAALLIDVGIPAEEYSQRSAYDLLQQAARKHLAFDQRLLHALLDDPARTMQDILRFALEDRSQDRIDISADLMSIFGVYPVPEAMPFLVRELRRFPSEEAPDELMTAMAAIGRPAVDPLLGLIGECGDAGFLLAALGVRDDRILEALLRILERDPEEGVFLLGIYGDPAARPALERYRDRFPGEVRDALGMLMEREGGEPRSAATLESLLDQYPRVARPCLLELPVGEREELLASPSAELRAASVESWTNGPISRAHENRFLAIAQTDADESVRALAWDLFRNRAGDERVRPALLRRLSEPGATLVERAAIAACLVSEPGLTSGQRKAVAETIDEACADPLSRPRALAAMGLSMDPQYAPLVIHHLNDPDPAVRLEAVIAAGMLGLSDAAGKLVSLFRDEQCRTEALFAYALVAPAKPGESGLKQLAKEMEELAGSFDEADEDAVSDALQLRAEADADAPGHPASATGGSAKVGRNAPCPCGSGKKYKKCCGMVH